MLWVNAFGRVREHHRFQLIMVYEPKYMYENRRNGDIFHENEICDMVMMLWFYSFVVMSETHEINM